MVAVPRYCSQTAPALSSADFRPFFLLAATWAALTVPLWLAFFAGADAMPKLLPPRVAAVTVRAP